MTDLEQRRIVVLRSEGKSYNAISHELKLSVNTVKTFCRRNRLGGDRRPIDTQPENVSVTSHSDGLLYGRNRGNSTVKRSDKGVQTNIELTVTYAEKPDGAAIADVLSMLISASYEVRK
ncbi:MAG: response regulator transcription factor [Clostridia bacterium]|nr:response regulator transcription factor [Clostridia bacterium]